MNCLVVFCIMWCVMGMMGGVTALIAAKMAINEDAVDDAVWTGSLVASIGGLVNCICCCGFMFWMYTIKGCPKLPKVTA